MRYEVIDGDLSQWLGGRRRRLRVGDVVEFSGPVAAALLRDGYIKEAPEPEPDEREWDQE
jgi:hypothetical protein